MVSKTRLFLQRLFYPRPYFFLKIIYLDYEYEKRWLQGALMKYRYSYRNTEEQFFSSSSKLERKSYLCFRDSSKLERKSYLCFRDSSKLELFFRFDSYSHCRNCFTNDFIYFSNVECDTLWKNFIKKLWGPTVTAETILHERTCYNLTD